MSSSSFFFQKKKTQKTFHLTSRELTPAARDPQVRRRDEAAEADDPSSHASAGLFGKKKLKVFFFETRRAT